MNKTFRNTKEVLGQELKSRELIYESLLFFHGIAFAHKALKIDPKGELKNHENK